VERAIRPYIRRHKFLNAMSNVGLMRV
jgi:hypothetical protein